MEKKDFDELFTKKYTDNKSIIIREDGEVTENSLEGFLDSLGILNDEQCLMADFIGVVV